MIKPMYAYLISSVAVIFTSLCGSYFTSKSVKSDWYDSMRPSITPPAFVFPIVWTILYILIAIAFGRVISANNWICILLFAINLMLNISWCYLYFYKKSPSIALVHIIFILLTILNIMYVANDKIVVYLMIPYLAWVSFATLLNFLSIKRD